MALAFVSRMTVCFLSVVSCRESPAADLLARPEYLNEFRPWEEILEEVGIGKGIVEYWMGENSDVEQCEITSCGQIAKDGFSQGFFIIDFAGKMQCLFLGLCGKYVLDFKTL